MATVRDAFFNRISGLIEAGEDIVIVTSDLGAPSLDDIRINYPKQYISVGIAEQNLISVAAGLAIAGKTVIAYGLNPFPVTRAFDQIRSLMAEQSIPVTLCALNAGLCAAECGYTHMPIEDMGMTRMLSNIRILNPSDETMAEALAEETVNCQSPRYIRFDKSIQGVLYEKADMDWKKGFCAHGKTGSYTLAIITNGCFVGELRPIIIEYREQGYDIQLIDLYSLPIHEKALAEVLRQVDQILTIEENILACGIGSFILELLCDQQLAIPVKRLGLNLRAGYYDVFTDRAYIRRMQGLDVLAIKKVIMNLVRSEPI